MKVLQINSVCGVGSTGRIATDLYKILEEQGHECIIAYGREEALQGIKTIKIGTNFDNYIHVAKTRLFDKHGFSSIKATKEFIKKAKEYDPDVIHLHNIHGYYINIDLLFNYLKEANKPVVWTLHDCWAFTGHCAYFDYAGCDKWEIGCKGCPQKNEYPKSILKDNSEFNYLKKKELFNGVKDMTIVTPSKWLAELVKKSFLSNYKVEVINNGIDLNIFKPKESNFREKYNLEDKFIILGVANIWDERKGLKYFIELANKLDNSYQIVIVGINEKQKKQLPSNIVGITKTNNTEELVGIYSSADVFVNASFEETMGLVTIESLACGTPVIVNNSTAIPEFIDDSCGSITNIKDIDKTIDLINLFKTKPIKSINCINKAKQYEKKKKYMEYIMIYTRKEI